MRKREKPHYRVGDRLLLDGEVVTIGVPDLIDLALKQAEREVELLAQLRAAVQRHETPEVYRLSRLLTGLDGLYSDFPVTIAA